MVEHIKVNRIHIPDRFIQSRDIAYMADNIRLADHEVKPILVEEAPAGFYEIADGLVRVLAAKKLGMVTIPATVLQTLNLYRRINDLEDMFEKLEAEVHQLIRGDED